MEAEELSIREWLDGLRRGWGAEWGAAFEAVGLDMVEDLEELDDDEPVQVLQGALQAAGAKFFHIKKIIKAIRRQTAASGAAPQPPPQPGQQVGPESQAAVDTVTAVGSPSRRSHSARGAAVANEPAAAAAAAGGDSSGGGGVAESTGKRFCAFLSHHKAGAAMEARWIKGSMESRLGRGAQAFLDSDDLNDLHLLMSHVRDSDVLCLLQTAEVLLRPFCILELNEAIVSGVPIVALCIRGKGYDFADMATYMARGVRTAGGWAERFSLVRPSWSGHPKPT